MKKFFLIGLVGVCFASQSFAQICGGIITDSGDPPSAQNGIESTDCSLSGSDYSSFYRHLESYQLKATDAEVNVHVNLVIWQESDGSGNWQNTAAQLNRLNNIQQLVNDQWINKNAGPSDPVSGVTEIPNLDKRIQVIWENIVFIPNSTEAHSTSLSGKNTYLLNNHPDLLNQLNIHVVMSPMPGAYWGYSNGAGAFYPAVVTSDDPQGSGYNCTMPGGVSCPVSAPNNVRDWSWAHHLAHEIGHNLDLKHVYYGGNESCNSNAHDYMDDIFPLNAAWCNPPSPPVGCNVCVQFDDPWVDPSVDPNDGYTNNLMNGHEGRYLSPKQCGKMHRALRRYNIKNFTSGYSTTPREIVQNETWDFQFRIYSDLVIKSGNTLTVKCLLQMPSQGRIFVEPGAHLIVDGGHITNSNINDGQDWSGIYLEGNSNLAQVPANQGKISLINDGKISNARDAITNISVNASGNWIWGTTGGIIYCEDAHFENNRRDVQLLAYVSPDAKNEKYDATFLNTTFKRNDGFGIESVNPSVTMWGVAGVDVKGCTFENTNTSDFAYDGGAIYTIKASYKVTESSATTPSIFKGYADAVRSESDISVAFPIKIIGAQFENNIHSVYLNSVVGSRVSHNNFKVRTSHSYVPPAGSNFQNSAYGVYMDYSSGFALEENVFENLDNTNNLSAAIVVKDNCGASDQVYHNTIDEFYFGIQAINNNQNGFNSNLGLNFICNECGTTTANTKDIQVNENGLVAGIQGENLRLPNNLFSPNTLTRHFDNFGSYTISYEYGTGNNRVIPTQHLGINPIASTSQAAVSTNCPVIAKPEALPGPVLTELNQIENALSSDRLLMSQLLDEGSTPQLESQILFASNQTEYQTLYLDLMDISPYVSIDNLLNVIYIEDYPELALRNILLANPHGLRDGEVWDAITNRTPALSQQTIDDLENGQQTITARDVLDRQIANKQVSSERLSNQYIRYHADHMDSVGLNSLNVIENHLRTRDELHFRYALVDLLIYKDQAEAAHDVLDSIPLACEMGAEDEADYYSMVDYYNLLRNLSTEEHQIEGQAMTDLMDIEATGSGYAVGRARALLKLNNQPVSYIEPLIDQNGALMSKRAMVVDRPEFASQTFALFPNPASTVAVIQWDADKEGLWEEKISIRVINVAGAIVHDQVIPDASINAAQINVESWLPGNYIVEVISKQTTIFEQKLNVQP
tara:strand:- start:1255 stop:4851 length:3597 start_codon:yes stop_codon:yes gene_type:complete